MNFEMFLVGIQQGLILAIIAYAVMIPFRLLNLADLSAEGAFPLGGALTASCLLAGTSPLIAILIGIAGSGILGIATSLVCLFLNVNSLLAGIIISTMAYSVNLRILGKPNVALFSTGCLFNTNQTVQNILILFGIILLCITLLALFLRTDFGLKLRAVGFNSYFAKKQNISITKYTILGLCLAGCMSGLAGALIVQLQNYMDIGIGVGIVIHGLASLMIGEALLGNATMNMQLLAPLLGALLYQQIQGIALFTGLNPADLKLFTGSVTLIVIAIKNQVEGRKS